MGRDRRRHRRGARRHQHLRRLPGDRADARDVQEEGTAKACLAEARARRRARVTASPNVVALLYLAASVLFILALKGLSHPLTARRGNLFGIAGMSMAVVTTLAISGRIDIAIGALAVGGVIGWIVAKRVEMTQMPELVAAMHSLVGLAAVLIAIAVVNNPTAFGVTDPIPAGNRVELFIGTFVGAMTFSGSVIAFGKLAGLGKQFRLISCAPVVFKGQQLVNLALAGLMLVFGRSEERRVGNARMSRWAQTQSEERGQT